MHSDSIDVEEQKSDIEEIIIENTPNTLEFGGQKMKNIIKRKDGRWYGRKQILKTVIGVYAKTQYECKLKLKKAIDNFFSCKIEDVHLKFDDSFYNFSIEWFNTYKKGNIVPKSERQYLTFIEQYIKKLRFSLSNLTVMQLQNFINNLPPTRIREFAYMTIKQITKKAYEQDLIKKDIGQFLEKGKINKGKVSWFTLEEQKKILNNLDRQPKWFSLTIYTLLLTGCRPNELNTIKKENVKKNMMLVDGTKTKNAKRWIKISNWLQNELLNAENDSIFENVNLDTLRHCFKEFLRNLDIEGHLYMLRHSYATNLFYLGVPDKERQTYMGHASSVITNDIYTEFDPTITKKDILSLYINFLPSFDTIQG